MKIIKNPGDINFSSQSGSSLLEVMVAVMITSVGLLGLAALQNTSLKLSYDSYLRTQASFMAYDLIDRVRANSDAAPYELDPEDSLTATNCYYVSDADSGCNKSEMRAYDLYTWKKQVEEVLPGAVPSVTYTTATQQYTLNLVWEDRNELDDVEADPKQFVYHFKVY
jgi:type IV pilus assembly protein PilV